MRGNGRRRGSGCGCAEYAHSSASSWGHHATGDFASCYSDFAFLMDVSWVLGYGGKRGHTSVPGRAGEQE